MYISILKRALDSKQINYAVNSYWKPVGLRCLLGGLPAEAAYAVLAPLGGLAVLAYFFLVVLGAAREMKRSGMWVGHAAFAEQERIDKSTTRWKLAAFCGIFS